MECSKGCGLLLKGSRGVIRGVEVDMIRSLDLCLRFEV
jgi:hypothetical protein